MLKNITICAAFALLVLESTPVTAAPSAVTTPVARPPIDDPVVFESATVGDEDEQNLRPVMVKSMMTWLAGNFDLPATGEPPRIEFASRLRLVSMRYKGVLPEGWREDSIRNPSVQAAHSREVLAVYNDKTKTIYLHENWTGATPAEQSVLVHELVHHLQNVGNRQYECPAAREKLAYEAQGDWLKLHGTDIEAEFGLDLFTIFVSSACIN